MATEAQVKAAAAALITQAASRDGVVLTGDILACVPPDMAEEAIEDARAALDAAAKASNLILPGDINGHSS